MTTRQPAGSSEELTRMGRLRPLFMAWIGLACGALLLLLGGRWDWIEGWLLAALFLAYLVGTSLWVVRHAPGLSSERAHAVAHPGSRLERLILIWVVVVQVGLIVVAALDGGRFQWSQVPIGVEIAGFVIMVGYIVLNLWVMVHNAYLSAVVRIQDERGQTVVTTGPYRIVRHPMYTAICLMAVGVPLALGSWWALIPGGLVILTFVLRTYQEDRFLAANLSGYVEYMQQTRYRLVPGAW
jgi:protein-S-isoprenylcysteine O-methyltransferase Ste14